MSIFEFRDYKEYLRSWVASQPKRGHGILKKIADHLRISPTMLSHILNGDKDLSAEAAHDLADYLGLSDMEFDYLSLLIQISKAGSFSLKSRLERKIVSEQKKALELKKRLRTDETISEESRALFYSNWLYAGIRNLSACPGFQTVDDIAKRLNISRGSAQKIIDFLLENQLCLMNQDKLLPGPAQTHLGHDSVFVSRHHQNWRNQAVTKMSEISDKNLFFSSPMSLSVETAELIRQKLPSFIEEIMKVVRPSPSEVVRCLNIDWFEY